ncbi:MAG: hypothetical protein JO358_12310, partial [Alphaproteobacteria bacterium]|nr:hypothetical protein [Alphaproteobacteria bacterium]
MGPSGRKAYDRGLPCSPALGIDIHLLRMSVDGENNPEEIVAAMQAFRSGERSSTVMGRIAKGFSDDEIRAIA